MTHMTHTIYHTHKPGTCVVSGVRPHHTGNAGWLPRMHRGLAPACNGSSCSGCSAGVCVCVLVCRVVQVRTGWSVCSCVQSGAGVRTGWSVFLRVEWCRCAYRLECVCVFVCRVVQVRTGWSVSACILFRGSSQGVCMCEKQRQGESPLSSTISCGPVLSFFPGEMIPFAALYRFPFKLRDPALVGDKYTQGWPDPYIHRIILYVWTFPEGVDGANILKCDFFDADHV